jgi:hypothetical protein
MVYGVSNDGLAIVLAIIGVGGPIGLAILFQLRNELKNQTIELRNQTNNFVHTETEMDTMNNFLKQITLSQIDEKVAMLRGYALDAKHWKNIEGGVTTMTDRIVADITAMLRVRRYIADDQKIKLNEAFRHLTDSMSANNYDIGRIEDVSKLLNSP